MTLPDTVAFLRGSARGYAANRVCAELAYALSLAKVKGSPAGGPAEEAAGFLFRSFQRDQAITAAAARKAEQILLPLRDEAKRYEMLCVAHAHIDMNWMWGFQETVAVALDTFRTVLNLMDEYPPFTFSQSQASVYRIAEEYDPELFERIRERVKEGRWEISASTWVEADKNMTSGESLARQILYTKRYFQDKFGLAPDDLPLDFEPDTFGHSANVPEILAKGGVKYYYHCRGHEKDIVYRWEAPSGESLLVFCEPTWYNDEISSASIERWPLLCAGLGLPFLLRVYGIGDHGGGPTRRDIERLMDMNTWPVAPTIRFSSYREFFRRLEERRGDFPVVRGELNYIFTGCYSSQARIKASNRAAEDALLDAEAATSLAVCLAGGTGRGEQYRKAWERTLFNQFHDILPGSGVRETREYALGRFQEAMGFCYAGRSHSLSQLAAAIDTSSIESEPDASLDSASEGGGVGFKGASDGNSGHVAGYLPWLPERGRGKTRVLHFFNPAACARTELAEAVIWDFPGDAGRLRITDPAGAPLPFAVTETGGFWLHTYIKLLVYIKIPPCGYTSAVVREQEREEYDFGGPLDPRIEAYPENVLENERIRAEFDEDMELVSLREKATGRELVSSPAAFFELVEQNPRSGTVMNGNAWVEGFPVRCVDLNRKARVFLTGRRDEAGLRRWISYDLEFGGSRLKVRVSLDRNAAVLDFSVDCDWREAFDPTRGIPALRFKVPLGYRADAALCRVPFGFIKRPALNHDIPADGLACATAGDGQNGVALLADSVYAFRFESNALSATLLRASQEPDPLPEMGKHTYRLGLAVCGGRPETLEEQFLLFAHPLIPFSNTVHTGSLPLAGSFLLVEGGAALAALKLPEDGAHELVVRLFDATGKGCRACLRFSKSLRSARIADLLENPGDLLPIENGSKLELPLKPFEVATLRVSF